MLEDIKNEDRIEANAADGGGPIAVEVRRNAAEIITGPMSGFFMMDGEVFVANVEGLCGTGSKYSSRHLWTLMFQFSF
jgi:hypothetical protein